MNERPVDRSRAARRRERASARHYARAMTRFLDGVGFLDAMLTSAVVLSVVIACVTILYRYFLR